MGAGCKAAKLVWVKGLSIQCRGSGASISGILADIFTGRNLLSLSVNGDSMA